MKCKNEMANNSVRLLALLVASFSSGVYAQEPSDEATAENVEEIVVTGTRIKRTNASSSMPLQILGLDELESSGTGDLAESLSQIPGVSFSVSPQSSNSSIQTSGLSTISLRRLGDNRTLVLVNGKRAVSNSGNADRVSLSTLPSGFVKRTEVTTGGASAIYGSDAIAGVANFVLEDSFEGFRFDVRHTAPDASGGDEDRFDGLFGTSFSGGRGYLIVGGTYRDEDIVLADSSRPDSIRNIEFDDPSTSSSNDFANERSRPGCDGPNEDKFCFVPSFSGTTPGGVFEGDAWFKNGRWFNDKELNPGDRKKGRDFFSDFDGFKFRNGRTLHGSRKIFNTAFHGSFEFTDSLKGSVTAMYSDVESVTTDLSEGINEDEEIGSLTAPDLKTLGEISATIPTLVPEDPNEENPEIPNPFIPAEVDDTLKDDVTFSRRLTELGEQARINDRKTTRIMADLKGELANDFSWEAFATYGHFKQVQENPNEVNFLNTQFALDIEEHTKGNYRCRNETARDAGCVPLNIFGAGSITPEAANYIRYNGNASQSRDQYTLGAHVSGSLFDVADRPVQSVFGFEWRREEQDTFGDPDGDKDGGVDGNPATEDFNVTSLAVFPSVSADYDVIEAFTEFDFPLASSVNATLAARYADYSTVGGIASYNAGVQWRALESLSFRTQYSLAQRAPSITEFFSPPRQDSDSLDDPCDGLEFNQETGQFDTSGIGLPAGTGGDTADLAVVRKNCSDTSADLNKGITAWLADTENEGEEFDGANNVQGPNAGAEKVNGVEQIKEETANTFTAGFVFAPDYLKGFTFIADYYSIDIDDAISSLSTQDVVDFCYSASDFPTSQFCNPVSRNPGNGDVSEVINYAANLDNVVVEGVDVSVKYELDMDTFGELDFDLRMTHYLTDETVFTGINNTKITKVDLGEIENSEDEIRFKLGYKWKGFRATYTVNYLSGGIDDINSNANPEDDKYFRVGGTSFHRIYASYTFDDKKQYRLYGGVNNVTNNFGPFLPGGLDHGSSRNIVSDMNDTIGREVYLGFRMTLGGK